MHSKVIESANAEGVYRRWREECERDEVEACFQRVAERVKHGGHNIPSDVIERHYFRSARNVMFEYAAACNSCICLANWEADGLLVFRQRGPQRAIMNNDVFTKMMETANNE